MVKNKMRPVHLGEILRKEYFVPMGMSVHALSQALRVPAHAAARDRQGAPFDHSIYIPFALSLSKGAVGALLRYGCAVVAEPANEL